MAAKIVLRSASGEVPIGGLGLSISPLAVTPGWGSCRLGVVLLGGQDLGDGLGLLASLFGLTLGHRPEITHESIPATPAKTA